MLGGDFASPWRLERGAILDVGPHMIDMLDAALGAVVGVRAHGNPTGWVGLLLEHETGAVSEASLCLSAPGRTPPSRVDVYGRLGGESVDRDSLGPDVFATMLAEFAEAVRTGGGHPWTPPTACACRASSPPPRTSSVSSSGSSGLSRAPRASLSRAPHASLASFSRGSPRARHACHEAMTRPAAPGRRRAAGP
nr:hypothetical protein GCM10020093_109910 [Planobispora longispora]